ncbi:MAG: KpsF/GutQ family sugar-phosphate isomerase [Pseudomonadota bacterium]
MMTQQLKTSSTQGNEDLTSARQVLALEAAALKALADSLDDSFAAALDLLQGVNGRVIVTGMGKSGHIARKIAATLASTGTPALYVHPGEASHGDLGMITREDGVLALSNSGNTTELGDVVAFSRRFQIPLVAITARRDSGLANDADIALILPRSQEACPMGLAPTTSTTMMLALGDAIAIALLERKGFSAQDFHLLHPGGTLGARLLRVGDVMRGPEELPLCELDTPMAEAILVMTERNFGCVGVLGAERHLAGIITDGDLRRHMAPDLLQRRAGDVMTTGPQTIEASLLAAEAVGRMNLHGRGITSLFVVEGDKPIGIVRMHDCLRAGVT